MNDLETGYSLTPCKDTQPPKEDKTPAPATVYGRQESDENYKGVISREGHLRIVNCPDDIQWIASGEPVADDAISRSIGLAGH
jgi:hypothetical protein